MHDVRSRHPYLAVRAGRANARRAGPRSLADRFQEVACGPWTVHVGAMQGRRPRMEDAWRVLPKTRVGHRDLTVLGVFDGVGGSPGGAEAAQAAAKTLEQAAVEGMDDLLGSLNAAATQAGGATTAVVVALDPMGHDGGIACVGDSSAYTLRRERLHRLTPRDAAGRHLLTDHLGHPGMHGHLFPFAIGREPLLLCTDGVDGVLRPTDLEDLLRAPDGALGAAFELLFDAIEERGAPDNATAILATLN